MLNGNFFKTKYVSAVLLAFAFALLNTIPVMAVQQANGETVLQPSFEFVGRAYEPDTGLLLYTEKHSIQLNEAGQYQAAKVVYRDSQGELFAEKTLDYDGWPTMPTTYFNEIDSPFYFKVKSTNESTNDGKSSGDLTLEYQDEKEDFKEQVPVEKPKYAVVDAGFDRLVSGNWQSLISGDALTFSFLAVTRSAFYQFRLVPIKQSDSDKLVLRLEPDNAIFRWLLDPAYLTYSVKNKKLIRFEGLTNIRKRINGQPQDENYVAVIEYDYL